MNLRYYLRGLGIGIIVTAIIMGITSGKEPAAPDPVQTEDFENVQERGVLANLEERTEQSKGGTTAAMEPAEEQRPAQEMMQPEDGSTASKEVVDDQSGERTEQGEDSKETPTGEALPETVEESQTSPEPEEAAEDGNEAADGSAGEPVEVSAGGDSIVLEIAEGDSSYAISRKLEEAGMISSAAAFDRYLYDNGYDRRLRAGTYEIPADTQPEDIAKILMN